MHSARLVSDLNLFNMRPFPRPIRWVVLCVILTLHCTMRAQLEDVSMDYLIEATTFGSLFGCGLSTADFNGWLG